MPSLDLVIVVLRTLHCNRHENFYKVRKHLDIAFSHLSYLSDMEQIEKAVNAIDNKFFDESQLDKEFIKKELVVIVSTHLKKQ